MQSESANFTNVAVPPPGELDETYATSLILANSIHYVKIWWYPQNQNYATYCTTIRRGSSHGHR